MRSSTRLPERRAAGGRTTVLWCGVLACLCGAIAARAGAAPPPSPPDSGCERPLQLAPARGPAGTVVELTGECQSIHSGASAPVYFDGAMIGRVSGETGGDFQNLVQIPSPAASAVHEVRIEQSSVRASATFAVTAARPCVGDCRGDAAVSVDELVTGVNIALARRPLEACAQFDADGDARVAVAELIAATACSLDGCVDPVPLATLAGAYSMAVSPADDFSPGAVQAAAAVVTALPQGVLRIEFPYWPGTVRVVMSFAPDGTATLQGSVVLADETEAPVAGTALLASDAGQHWITGTLTLEWLERSERVHFVMRRAAD